MPSESASGRLNLQFWLLIVSTFFGFLGIGAVLPALAPHIRLDLYGSDQTVGRVIGIFSFVALLSRFFSGPMADRKGRKLTFQIGLFSCALAGAAYFLPLRLSGAYLGRVLQGFGEACLYTGAAAWAVEAAGVGRSARALGYLSSAIWGGLSAGPALGSWLGSFRHAAAFQLASAGLGFLLSWFVREDFRPSLRTGKHEWLPRRMIAPGVSVGFTNVFYPVIAGFLILHLRNHGNSGPAAFTAFAGVVLLLRFFLGGLPDRVPASITFYGGVTVMAAALLILAAAPAPKIAISAAALLGLGYAFPWSSLAATVLRRTPTSEHGATIGVIGAFYDLAVGLSSLAAGSVAGRFGYGTAFVMAAIALIPGALIAWGVFFPRAEPDHDPVISVEEVALRS